jgi:hypothetical protein
MLESVGPGKDLDVQRKFGTFCEVHDMSLVASHCREVGLESLFLTSMKVSNSVDTTSEQELADEDQVLYGVLVHVDHMNDGKAYCKWLRKACSDLDVVLLIQKCYLNQDFSSKRPLILAGLVGSNSAVSSVLKKWRTSLVDVDSRGQPCRERMMTILSEGPIRDVAKMRSSRNAWNKLSSESQWNTTIEKVMNTMQSAGVPEWVQAIEELVS